MSTPLRRSGRTRKATTANAGAALDLSDDSGSEIRVPDDSDSEDEYRGGGGGGKGDKGKGGTRHDTGGGSGSGSGSDDDDDHGVDEDEEESDPEAEEDWDADDTPHGRGGRGRGRGRGRGGGTPRARATPGTPKTPKTPRGVRMPNFRTPGTGENVGRRSTATALYNSTLNAFPPAYRDLLLQSANGLTRKDGADKTVSAPLKVPPFPLGPVTPFVTHLSAAPAPKAGQIGGGEVLVRPDPADEGPHGEARREHMKELAKGVAVIAPWEAWEGEGWWPEMCSTANEVNGNDTGKGRAEESPAASGPMEGWQWRSDVRLGLDGVGRGTVAPMDISEGQRYVPLNGQTSISVGRPGQETTYLLNRYDTAPIENIVSSGFLLDAGSPVWGLDWCPYPDRLAALNDGEQYIAVSTIPQGMRPTIGSRCAPDTPGSIQIWTVAAPGESADCDLVLCLLGGPAVDLRWMPLGAWDEIDEGSSSSSSSSTGPPKIGIIAAVQLDGNVTLYAVPHPRALPSSGPKSPIYLRAEPLLTLTVADTAVTCIQWHSGRRLVAGLANGHVVAWDVVDALKAAAAAGTPQPPPLPSVYATAALSAIRSISAGRCPPTDAKGDLDYTGDPLYITFGAFDGTTGVLDLRDPSNVVELNRSRLPCMATGWAHQVGVPLYADVDYMVIMSQTRAGLGPSTYYLAPHRGPVWEIATSDYHTMIASASSDGSVLVSSCGMGFYRRKQGGMLFQRLYELDYDSHTGEYRMSEQYRAEASGLEEATSKATHKVSRTKGSKAEAMAPTTGDAAVVKTGAWNERVGVHRVAWQSGAGISRANWIASGGWSGIVRVEMLMGKWMK